MLTEEVDEVTLVGEGFTGNLDREEAFCSFRIEDEVYGESVSCWENCRRGGGREGGGERRERRGWRKEGRDEGGGGEGGGRRMRGEWGREGGREGGRWRRK